MKRQEPESTPRVAQCLFAEHRHLTALTRLMADKAAQPGRLVRGDWYLLRDVVGYLHDYPDRVHHPTENLLFDIVVRRDPAMQPAAERLRREHDVIAAETGRILGWLDRLIDAPDDGLERRTRAACRAFAKKQQAHMRFENHELLPVAIASLSRTDWRRIERHFAAVDDPLFGPAIGRRYRLLYEYLTGPADVAEAGLAGLQMRMLERLMFSGQVLEEGIQTGCARLRELGDRLLAETRSAFAEASRPPGLTATATLPARYSAALARSLLGCGVDLARIGAGAVVKSLKSPGRS